jgi:diguanylate cyclase (GGDEF)-like protein
MAERSKPSAKPARTSLYREATWLAVALRWILLAGGAIWLYPEYGLDAAATRIVLGVASYGLLLTVLHWYKLHPPLWFVSLLDLAAITALLVVLATPSGAAIFVYAFVILTLTLAYGWKGAAFSVTAYLACEYAVLLVGTAGWPEAWVLIARCGSLAAAALVLGALVERHETLRLRLARAAVAHPKQGVHDLQEFTNALEFLHKLAVRGKWPYAVMVIDIEQPGVKAGYQDAGIDEQLLRQLAAEATAALRSTDIVGRVGADVFAIAMPDTPEQGAEQVARRIEKQLRDRASELDYFVGLSVVWPSRKNAYDECLHSAFASARESKATR